jgi:hypothetical protein
LQPDGLGKLSDISIYGFVTIAFSASFQRLVPNFRTTYATATTHREWRYAAAQNGSIIDARRKNTSG